jgi:hypothetical protein
MSHHPNNSTNSLPPDPLAVVIAWWKEHVPRGSAIAALWPWLVLFLFALVTVLVLVAWWRGGGAAGRVREISASAHRNDGVASAAMIRRTASRRAMRRRATVLLPSLRQISAWQRFRTPTTAYATRLARVGRRWIWSPVEDVTLRVGGPRTGKTGELAGRILDAPGAVLATTTKTDLVDLTAPCRGRERPVYVFNPSGMPGHPTTLGFDPVSGCADIDVAAARAADLLGSAAPGGDGDREYWSAQGHRALTALLHAAALGDLTMRDVLTWLAEPDGATPTVTRLLRRSDQSAVVDDVAQLLGTNERTRSSIISTVMPCLGWLSSGPALAAATGPQIDVETLLRNRATIYLLGAEDSKVAPLVAAFTGHVAREARRISATMPGGRLDPPLTLVLDEAALICPVPLDNWTADMGGRNITIHIAVQSRAQLRQRWGDTGAAAILNNAATLLIFGGARDQDDLATWSALTGERLEQVVTRDAAGRISSTSTRRVPVLSPADIAQLPAGHVLIARRGMPPTVGIVQMAWRRRDVRAAQRKADRAPARQILATDGGAA